MLPPGLRARVEFAVERQPLHGQLGAIVLVVVPPDNPPAALRREAFAGAVERGVTVHLGSGGDDEPSVVPHVLGDEPDDGGFEVI